MTKRKSRGQETDRWCRHVQTPPKRNAAAFGRVIGNGHVLFPPRHKENVKIIFIPGVFYASIIVGTIGLNAAVPLIYELGCELGYPTGEGTTNTVLTIVNNLFGLIFLLVMMVPGIGTLHIGRD